MMGVKSLTENSDNSYMLANMVASSNCVTDETWPDYSGRMKHLSS